MFLNQDKTMRNIYELFKDYAISETFEYDIYKLELKFDKYTVIVGYVFSEKKYFLQIYDGYLLMWEEYFTEKKIVIKILNFLKDDNMPVNGTVDFSELTSFRLDNNPDFRFVEVPERRLPEIKKVIFNNPATIVIWEDGTKTISKICKGDKYDEKMGLYVCIAKKVMGGNGEINRLVKEYGNE